MIKSVENWPGSTCKDPLIDTRTEGFPSLEQAQKEWQRTVFASPTYTCMARCRQPAWMVLEVLAQALWALGREAVRCGHNASCATAAELAVEFDSAVEADMPPRARMNAAYTLTTDPGQPRVAAGRSDRRRDGGAARRARDRRRRSLRVCRCGGRLAPSRTKKGPARDG